MTCWLFLAEATAAGCRVQSLWRQYQRREGREGEPIAGFCRSTGPRAQCWSIPAFSIRHINYPACSYTAVVSGAFQGSLKNDDILVSVSHLYLTQTAMKVWPNHRSPLIFIGWFIKAFHTLALSELASRSIYHLTLS